MEGLVYLVLAFIALFFIILYYSIGVRIEKKIGRGGTIAIVAIISVILGFVAYNGLFKLFGVDSSIGSSGSSGGGYGSGNTRVCKVCGRSFESGDGNYKNIARTGMCNNCYSNYQWGMNAQGKDVLGNPLK